MKIMTKPVILTGIRANNDLHIGNYFGAMLPVIDMAKTRSDEYDIHLFIPDLHSFTTPIDHDTLQASILNNIRVYAAAGLPLDSEAIRVYRQSYVPAHSELTWILDCFTSFGQMSRMTQFKDKSSSTDATVGLFNYPVLMAADILLYGAEYVPVGDDQTQHLEFTRDIAERMNSKFGELFVVPKPVKDQHTFFGKDQGLRIKDLLDPSKKMSKSDESGKGAIFLNDSPEAGAAKVMGAATDSEGSVRLDFEKQPGIANLLQIAALLRQKSLEDTAAQYEGQSSYGDFKKEVAGLVHDFLADFQSRLGQTSDEELYAFMDQSEVKANEMANATLYKVQQAVGLRPKA